MMETTTSTTGEQAYQARQTITPGHEPKKKILWDGGGREKGGVGGEGEQGARPDATAEQQQQQQKLTGGLRGPQGKERSEERARHVKATEQTLLRFTEKGRRRSGRRYRQI